MSDLDGNALGDATNKIFYNMSWSGSFKEAQAAADAAIRAYEAHKASAASVAGLCFHVPEVSCDNCRPSAVPEDWSTLTLPSDPSMTPSAVPEEIAEVVMALREAWADSISPKFQIVKRAADLLVRLATPSAVPEEIAEVVRRLRGISPNKRYADCMGSDEVECIQKAADLLERLASK